jgi:hypothetical protein
LSSAFLKYCPKELTAVKSNFHKSDLAALFVSIFRKNESCNHNLIFLKIKQEGLIVAVLQFDKTE